MVVILCVECYEFWFEIEFDFNVDEFCDDVEGVIESEVDFLDDVEVLIV